MLLLRARVGYNSFSKLCEPSICTRQLAELDSRTLLAIARAICGIQLYIGPTPIRCGEYMLLPELLRERDSRVPVIFLSPMIPYSVIKSLSSTKAATVSLFSESSPETLSNSSVASSSPIRDTSALDVGLA